DPSGPARAQLATPAPVQVVRHADRVQHAPGDEVDELLHVAGARVEPRAGRQYHRARVVQGEQLYQVAAGQRGLAGYDHDRPALLEVDLGGALQQVLGQADGDAGAGGGAGGDDDHAPGRVRPAARPRREVPRRP